jgi:integrase
MKRHSNPLAEALEARVRLLATTLAPGTVTGYRHTSRLFLRFLHSQFPEVRQPGQLIRLRKLLDLLADHAHPPKPGWLWSEDIPRPDQLLPRPLTPEQDAALQTALGKRNDLLSNALLLMRLTGLRIGECADLAPDCLRHLGEDRWAIHVPVGKLHTERWVPGPEGTPEEGAR